MPHPPEQIHNHNPGSVTLNYPCLINRLRVVSHDRTKHRVAGPMSRITFCLSYPCRFTTHLSNPRWGPDPPTGAWGPAIDVFSIDAGRSRILQQHLPGGPPSTFFNVDGGCSRISVSTRQGARRRCFIALMVGAP
jgi:hypothetical protein